MHKTYVYVLELKDNFYYIGKTEHYEKRIKQHFSGRGAEWTKRHPPIRIYAKIEVDESIDAGKIEKLLTKFFALKYGKNKVRGYCWSAYYSRPSTNRIFTEENLMLLKKCKINVS